jgi:putative transposase
MPNHVHLVAVPKRPETLGQAIGRGHEGYTRYLNFKKRWRGYLWQGRFHSFPMDTEYLFRVVRYVELNPVSAAMIERAEDHPWSSARAHLGLNDDFFICTPALLQTVGDWNTYLKEGLSDSDLERIETHERSGRPLGSEAYVTRLEKEVGRPLRPKKRGPKPAT